jgi:MFS family permease
MLLRISVVILSLGVAISQLLISIGVSIRSFPMMLACRALFGICSESLITAQISLVSFWFKGKELATALGLIITLPELGGALNSFLTPIIYENTGSLSAGFYVGTAFCIFSFLCGCVLYWIEWRAEKEQKGFVGHVEVKTIKCEDMKQFNMKVWIIIAIGSLAAALYVPFMDNANRFYQKRFCYTQVDAGNAVMWIYLSAIITSIPLGLMIDKLGGRVYFFIGTMVAFLIAHLIYLFLPNCISDQIKGALSGSFFLGLGYSMYSNCVVPLFPLMVKSSIMGTAIGLLATFENIAESIVPELSSLIVHSQESEQTGYRLSELFYCGLAVIGVLVAMLMFCYRKTCHRLNQVVCEELGDAYSSEA